MDYKLHPIKREFNIEGFHSIYYFEFDKNFSHTMQRNNFWEMMYVDSGKVNAIADGVGQIVTQGQMVFNRPMEVHAHVSNKVDPNNMLVITFTCNSPAMEFFNKKIFNQTKFCFDLNTNILGNLCENDGEKLCKFLLEKKIE